MPTHHEVRHFIRAWRKDRGLTQQRLADRIEMTAASISRVETGKQDYTQPMLEALADALQCTPGDLLSRKPGDPYGVHAVLDSLPPERMKQAEVHPESTRQLADPDLRRAYHKLVRLVTRGVNSG